jgi:hypothetical protein
MLWLDASRAGPGLVVEVRGPREGREAVKPLAAWLRRRPKWRGGYTIQLHVPHPEVVRRAFTLPGAVTSYRQLEEEAGLQWFPPWEWQHGISHMYDWLAMTKTALDTYLRERARAPQRDPFASKPPEA